jgi:hypothetical protein
LIGELMFSSSIDPAIVHTALSALVLFGAQCDPHRL